MMRQLYIAAVVCLLQLLHATAVTTTADGQEVRQPASWRSCSGSASYQVSAVDLQPSNVVPPGGQLSIVVDGTNRQQVTAGDATVTVWYYGVQVLSAGDTLCGSATPADTPASQSSVASSRKLKTSASSLSSSNSKSQRHHGQAKQQLSGEGVSDGATCTLAAGPLHMTHTATLPGIAPRGSYSMRLAASDMVTGQQILCLDVWFRVG